MSFFLRSKRLVISKKSFIKYILIGFTGLALDLLTFIFMVRVLGLNELFANPISMTVGIVNNFFWNAFLNFKRTDNLFRRFLTFYSVGLFGIFFGNTFLWFFHTVIGDYVNGILLFASPLAAHYQLELIKATSIVIIAIMQYFLNKRFSFRP
ncbi:GtrA family protein [bacterium]|nr:GtrA family protein [bacterium]